MLAEFANSMKNNKDVYKRQVFGFGIIEQNAILNLKMNTAGMIIHVSHKFCTNRCRAKIIQCSTVFLIELQNKDQVLENYILIPDIPNNGSNFSSDEEVKSVISIQTPCKV